MAATAAIMVAVLATIFNMVAKTQMSKCSNAPITKKIDIKGILEECGRDQCDFKMAVILTAVFKMAAKMRKISKLSDFNEN